MLYNCIMKDGSAITTLQQAEAYLSQFFSSKGSYTLTRMRHLMTELGNPETKLRIIHVGGTAGKGSTSYMTAAILEKAGYKVGLHMTPHMISVTERLMINRVPISDEKFVRLLNDVLPAIEKVTQSGAGAPTYFEITVAMMFKYFFDEKVDIAVIEVGLGGKLDGTNVLTPTVSVVTNVGLDHTEILGDTVEKIASDKREIIKTGVPAISAATQPTVRALIMEKAATVGAPLFFIDRDFSVKNITIQNGVIFDYESKTVSFKRIFLSLLGRHQATNAALAITAISHCGLPVGEENIRKALGEIKFVGRLEITTMLNTRVVIDGAHNPMKMEALARALTDHFPTVKFQTLIAVKEDKDVSTMIRILSPHVSHWFVTTFERQTDWGKRMMFAATDLAKIIRDTDPNKPVSIVPSYNKFLADIPGSNLLITGSLYLVGAVEEFIRKK